MTECWYTKLFRVLQIASYVEEIEDREEIRKELNSESTTIEKNVQEEEGRFFKQEGSANEKEESDHSQV